MSKHPKPSVDLGYPTPAHGKIPSFRNIEEEAEFWDTHDVPDYLEESRPATLTIAPELAEKVTVRLDRADRDELTRQAKQMGIGPSTLVRMWIREHLHGSAAAGSSSR